MIIKTKFNVGDQVFIIRRKSSSYPTECQTCGGTGKVHIREIDEEINCPSCDGKGFNIQLDTKYYKEGAIVSKIITKTNENGTEAFLTLFINDQYIDLEEEFVFTINEVNDIIKKGTAKDHIAFFGSSLISTDPFLKL